MTAMTHGDRLRLLSSLASSSFLDAFPELRHALNITCAELSDISRALTVEERHAVTSALDYASSARGAYLTRAEAETLVRALFNAKLDAGRMSESIARLEGERDMLRRERIDAEAERDEAWSYERHAMGPVS